MSQKSEINNPNLETRLDELAIKNAYLEREVAILSTLKQSKFNDDSAASDEIDLGVLCKSIWAGKWLIIAITFVFAISSVFYAISIPNEYSSTAILSPSSASGSSSLSKLAGKFGGLASLAGVNLGAGGEQDKTVIAMEIIKTWGFIETFIKDNNLEVAIFATKRWELPTNQLVLDAKIYNLEQQKWVREFDKSKGQKAEPSSWELYNIFKDRISISQDKITGLVTLSVVFYSPSLAKEWVDKLVISINKHIQIKDRQDATNSIKYLKEQITKTNISEMQSIFYQLIEEQTKTLMLAEISDEYVFKTISPAKIAEEKSRPKRAFIVVSGTAFGGILGCLIVLFRSRKVSKLSA